MQLNNVFKIAPLALIIVGITMFAMHQQTQPVAKIKVLTSDDDETVEIPKNIALKSSVIKANIEDLGESNAAIPLPNVSKADLEIIVSIIEKLDAADQSNIKREDGKYIAQRIQKIIDTALASLNEPQIGAFIRAAQYLDLEYIVNGAIRTLTQKALKANRQIKLENIIAYLYSQRGKIKKPQFQPEGLIAILKPIFEKHYALITAGGYRAAIPEMSIADYIQIKGMPKIEKNVLNLSRIGISSLDGLDQIDNISQVATLALSLNYLSSFPADAFKAVPNLERLHLEHNHILSFPPTIFSHVPKLKYLHLSTNQLTQLPANIFQPITKLRELFLSFNFLSTLPEGIFNNLTHLKKLALDSNKFDYIPATNTYPFPQNIFQPLVALKELYILNNPFSNTIAKYPFMVRYHIPDSIYII